MIFFQCLSHFEGEGGNIRRAVMVPGMTIGSRGKSPPRNLSTGWRKSLSNTTNFTINICLPSYFRIILQALIVNSSCQIKSISFVY